MEVVKSGVPAQTVNYDLALQLVDMGEFDPPKLYCASNIYTGRRVVGRQATAEHADYIKGLKSVSIFGYAEQTIASPGFRSFIPAAVALQGVGHQATVMSAHDRYRRFPFYLNLAMITAACAMGQETFVSTGWQRIQF